MNTPSQKQNSRNRTSLRLDADLISMIDKARFGRAGIVSRNTWIAEAVQEKLSRDTEKDCARVL